MSCVPGADLPAGSKTLRRRPVQQRSARRVARMLDACAELLDEVGYEAVTTTLIAEHAGVAVGSLYQFFDDKRAVAAALTARNLELFCDRVTEQFRAASLENWWDAVDAVLGVYVQMYREVPGFRRVEFGDVADRRLLDPAKDDNTVLAERLHDLLVEYLDVPAGTGPSLALRVAVEAADGLLELAFRRDSRGDAAVLGETRALLKRYLDTRLPDRERRRHAQSGHGPAGAGQPNVQPSPR